MIDFPKLHALLPLTLEPRRELRPRRPIDFAAARYRAVLGGGVHGFPFRQPTFDVSLSGLHR